MGHATHQDLFVAALASFSGQCICCHGNSCAAASLPLHPRPVRLALSRYLCQSHSVHSHPAAPSPYQQQQQQASTQSLTLTFCLTLTQLPSHNTQYTQDSHSLLLLQFLPRCPHRCGYCYCSYCFGGRTGCRHIGHRASMSSQGSAHLACNSWPQPNRRSRSPGT